MKKTIRLLVIICIAVLVMSCFTACSGEKSNDTTKDSVQQGSNDASDKTADNNDSADSAANNEDKKSTSDAADSVEMTDEIKKGAEEEGITAEKMLEIIRIRMEKEANNRGITLAEYLDMIKNNNSTPYRAVKEAADMLQMTIVEYHEMLEGIQTDVGNGGLSEADIPAGFPNDELPFVSVNKIEIVADGDEYIEISYRSDETYENLMNTYDQILNGTENYKLMDRGAATIKGTLGGKEVKVEICPFDNEPCRVNLRVAK